MGFKDGYGVFEVANGDVYSGDFKKGKRNGLGIEMFYTGERYPNLVCHPKYSHNLKFK